MSQEIKLLRASLQGDTAAFEQIVLRYQAMVCAITYSATGRVETSEELAQETFLRAWQKLIQLQDLNKFRSWLCSIARNLIRDYLLHKSRQPIQSADLTQLPADKTTPFDHLIKQEEEMILSQALMQIPEEFRESLVLYYRQGQSIKEVAESLDIPEATVRTRMHRGRQMLKDHVAGMVEKTLEKSGPTKKFSKAVMVAIGAGLAAGTAATAGVSAAGAATGISTATTGILTATIMKVTAIAAAVILATGVAIHSYTYSQKNISAQHQALTETSPQTKVLIPPAVKPDNTKPGSSGQQIPANPAASANQSEIPASKRPLRHPDWPKLNEPVLQFMSSKSTVTAVDENQSVPTPRSVTSSDNYDEKVWIKLPNQFRQENSRSIEIENGTEKIHIDKIKKTVQHSVLSTDGDTSKEHFAENKFFLLAKLFRYAQNPTNEPNAMQDYEIRKIGSRDDGEVLIYQLTPRLEKTEVGYDVKVYVDAATLLPEKIVCIYTDPNQSPVSTPEEATFDFSPIPDSLFSYQPQQDETQLPQKEPSGFYGHVVDLLNQPVAGAEVYVNYFPLWGLDYLKATSDALGQFEIKIPDKSPHNTSNINLPIYFWAILPDRQDFSAWTVLYEEYGIRNGVDPNLLPGFGGTIVSERKTGTGTCTKNGVTSTYQYFSPSLKDPVVRDIVLVMQPTGTIAGYVTDKAGNGIHGAKLECKYQFGAEPGKLIGFYANNFNWTFSATSDSKGYYIIKGLPSLWKYCRFSISVSVPGYAGENKEIVLDGPLSHLDYNISLNQQQVTIRGILKDNSGVPLADRSISLSAPGINLKDSSSQTDPNGYFEFKGCPDIPGLHVEAELSWNNSYNIIDQKEKYDAMLYYPNVGMDIPYNPGQKEYAVELTAIRPETEIAITVIDSAGHPIPDMKVQLDNTINFSWKQDKLQKRTDKNGVVKFTNIPDTQELTASVLPDETFTLEMHRLSSNFKERQRIDKLDQNYDTLYQKTEIPVPLVPGQKKYKMTIPVLTQEEYKQQKELEKSKSDSQNQ
jgi:RNA polymerase sigma factor (sigma-70 family)